MNYKLEITMDEMMSLFSMVETRRKDCERAYKTSLVYGDSLSVDYWRAEMERAQSIYDKLINAGV